VDEDILITVAYSNGVLHVHSETSEQQSTVREYNLKVMMMMTRKETTTRNMH
jgi:hypothetical protein